MRAHNHRRSHRSLRLRLEALEDRSLLTTYMITDLGANVIPTALNNNGIAVGYTSNSLTNANTSFILNNGTETQVTGVGSSVAVTGINDSNQIVGVSNTLGGFVLNNGVAKSLALDPVGISDNGVIAGNGNNGAEAVLPNVTVVTLDPGASYSIAQGISNNGLVAGYAPGGFSATFGGDADPWVWNPGNGTVTATDLGGSEAQAFGVNNSGDATGLDGFDNPPTQAFVYSNGVLQDIGTLGDNSQGNAINNSGVAVGEVDGAAGGAWVYSDGAMTNLSSLVPADSGFSLDNAVAINNSGQILVQATNTSGIEHAVLLNPVATVALTISSAPSLATAGVPFNVTITALNPNGTVDTGFTDTVQLVGNASGPINYTFTPADKGVHTFTPTLDTAGTGTLAFSDTTNPAVTGVQQNITVQAGPAVKLLPGSATFVRAGATFDMTVVAYDAFDNVATGYRGTVHFSDSVGGATLPANYMFTTADQGIHTFTGLKLTHGGEQTVTVADTHTPSIKGSIPIDVDVVRSVVASTASSSPLTLGIVGSDGSTQSWWSLTTSTPKRTRTLT